jgi:hypothetical protein
MANDLVAVVLRISEGGLHEATAQMTVLLTLEGLLGAPR